ncbi:short-chain fatty acid transporter [Rhodoplanes serenus]|jgi:short-chain fatty acids transporter|uniref:short-chain fatty acid transporter n=1 Tax=Rhodoplanes serenus TaxID=200615 RepID=UPI000DADB19D|nr:TIGR00366 family protein [Rhodoplanes serenus]RAI33880.1 Short chain fatty acid transporter [Rhodoplanes serenus]
MSLDLSVESLRPKSSRPAGEESGFARFAIVFTNWSERWYPDSFVFAALTVIGVAAAALALGSKPLDIANAFGGGFWSIITFTMQMVMVVVTGFVVATSPPAARFIDWIARAPRTARGAVAFVAFVSMSASFLNWAFSMVLGGLLVQALARRGDLRMDYRAGAAAAYLGLGATWALGINSSAAQLQANPASLPKSISDITGVIPFTETIFLWQSMLMALIILIVSVLIAYFSAPSAATAKTAEDFGIDLTPRSSVSFGPSRPGEWLERTPFISLALAALGFGFIYNEFATKDPLLAISNLNTYNLLFLLIGLVLHWRLGSFLGAVSKAVPSTSGVLIQFPLYGAIALMLTGVKGADGFSISHHIANLFVSLSTQESFPVLMGVYSAVLGFLVPSGGGKWIIEAPYVMQAAKDLGTHMGWAVQVYNAAEAIPNLINPFWMLPLLGVLGLKARDIVGFTFIQFLLHIPLVLFLLWFFGRTLLPG